MSGPPRGDRTRPGAKRDAGGKRNYVGDLGATLKQQDAEALRVFLITQARQFGDEAQATELAARSADEIVTLMHQMILARPDLAALHADSRAWLVERNLPVPPR